LVRRDSGGIPRSRSGRQLLGGIGTSVDGQAEGDHLWGHYPQATPLYVFLAERGLLDPANPRTAI
jgi:ectoine hydroxylase